MAAISPAKAKKILRDGSVKGHKLSPKQKRFMGAMSNAKSGTAVKTSDSRKNIIEGMKDGGAAVNETSTSRSFSKAKTLILEGMEEGGVVGPQMWGTSGPQDSDPAAGLKAVSDAVAALGEPGLQAMKLGLVSARQKYAQLLQAASAAGDSQFPGSFNHPVIPDFKEILSGEVGRAWAAIGAPKASSNPTPSPMATSTPTPSPMMQ